MSERDSLAEPLDASRPTTKDLARAAGVSRATVDRVLNGREGVKPKTVERVNRAIAELGFVRNLQAANLARSRHYRIVFLLPRSGDLFLDAIKGHVEEAAAIFAGDAVTCRVQLVDENDPHQIAAALNALTPESVAGVAIMAPETPQVRDAIARLSQRGIAALPFVSNQSQMKERWVGADNTAAGATAATLIGRFAGARRGTVMVVSETMQSRDSLDRRLGFDRELVTQFPGLRALPSLETYGNDDRAEAIIERTVASNPDLAGVYVLSSEARVPLTVIDGSGLGRDVVRIAHERTPFTEARLRDRRLDAVIAQDAGHLVRSAIRRIRGLIDGRETLGSQERIRVEVLLPTNL